MSFKYDEFQELNPFERFVVRLSIKYQMDLASMKQSEVKKLISKEDWQDLHDFMKYGQQIH